MKPTNASDRLTESDNVETNSGRSLSPWAEALENEKLGAARHSQASLENEKLGTDQHSQAFAAADENSLLARTTSESDVDVVRSACSVSATADEPSLLVGRCRLTPA